jgi:hypothetical protein
MELINTPEVIVESQLELVVSNQTLGSLTTNAKEIKSLVEASLQKYDAANYNEGNIDMAKKDKAMLNKAAKALNDKRISIEKEFSAPFQEFKETITDTVKLIGVATAKIDTVVKESEFKAKEEKRIQIEKIWEEQEYTIVPLQKVFDEKWLNKTASLKSIQSEIVAKINSIEDDIKTIRTLESDTKLLVSIYLDTLNINSTIQYANKLKENQKRIEETQQNAVSPEVNTQAPKAENINVQAEQVNPFENNQEVSAPEPVAKQPELLIRKMKVTGTYDQLVALGNFMNENGIHFEKIENEVA